jgi:hypothetical protein
MHRHDLDACELPIGGSSSTVAVVMRQQEQRRPSGARCPQGKTAAPPSALGEPANAPGHRNTESPMPCAARADRAARRARGSASSCGATMRHPAAPQAAPPSRRRTVSSNGRARPHACLLTESARDVEAWPGAGFRRTSPSGGGAERRKREATNGAAASPEVPTHRVLRRCRSSGGRAARPAYTQGRR